MKKLATITQDYFEQIVDGHRITVCKVGKKTMFSLPHFFNACGVASKFHNLRRSASHLGEELLLKAPTIMVRLGVPCKTHRKMWFVDSKKLLDIASRAHNPFPISMASKMLSDAGVEIKLPKSPSAPVVEMDAGVSEQEMLPASPLPIISVTENGEDTIVFKGKNILQRLFGNLLRP